jgi:hypothetical protein
MKVGENTVAALTLCLHGHSRYLHKCIPSMIGHAINAHAAKSEYTGRKLGVK